MKDEIKEIIDFLKDKRGYYKTLPQDKTDKLLDYITNLQTIEREYSSILSENAELESKITNLQKENEILKENAIHNDKVVDKSKWNEMIYKSRKDKAIEEINYMITNADITEISAIKLKQILGGKEND